MARTHDPFLWYELMTTDQPAAEAFYRAVVGWQTSPATGPNAGYTILSAGERGVGGILPMPADARAAGAQPGWCGYIHVADTDAMSERIVAAGGRVHRPPADIPEVGRFAVVADPGGAVFMLLTPLPQEQSLAAVPPMTPGHTGWHELYAGNGQEAAFAFYSGLFGWQTIEILEMAEMGSYRIIGGADGVPFGGMMDKPAQMPAAAWTFYFNVDALDPAIERIRANGGTVLMGPQEVPGGSWIVQGTDPEGVLFALVAPTR